MGRATFRHMYLCHHNLQWTNARVCVVPRKLPLDNPSHSADGPPLQRATSPTKTRFEPTTSLNNPATASRTNRPQQHLFITLCLSWFHLPWIVKWKILNSKDYYSCQISSHVLRSSSVIVSCSWVRSGFGRPQGSSTFLHQLGQLCVPCRLSDA